MIIRIKNRQTQALYDGERPKGFPAMLAERAQNKLKLVMAAMRLEDLAVPPGNHLEALRGDRKGQYSIRINQQWRICFKWVDGRATSIEICDYH